MAKKKAEPKESAEKPRGRPSLYTPELGARIAERLSKGEPLAQICRDEGMPAVRTVSDWRRDHEAFSADFARARDDGYDAIAADCLSIADETAFDTIKTDEGERANTEWISRSKLRIETRLKLLAKWDPKRYGDKLAVTGEGGGPIASATEITFKIVRPSANPAD